MDIFNNHKKLFSASTFLFLGLTFFVAIWPALNNQKINYPLPNAEKLSSEAARGKALFIANGCVACHTQQVRNVDMDRMWGGRPSMAADYAGNKRMDFWRNTATLMGTERTGPDLTDIGNRQPSLDWNLLHLYNPRTVVKESIMPAYPFLFIYKEWIDYQDIVVSVPESYMNGRKGKFVASQDALDLVAYLQSLKQTKLLENRKAPDFLYQRENKQSGNSDTKGSDIDGKALFTANCSSCHQTTGEGIPGAFPPLKGSPVVTGDNLKLYVDIIMYGYDAREEFGVMPAVGTNQEWTEKEVAAVINYERTSWSNNAKNVTPEEIRQIIDQINETKK